MFHEPPADIQVPIAIAGSKLCTEAILKDHSIPLPSTYSDHPAYSAKPPNPSSDLDRPRLPNLVHMFERSVLFLAPFVAGGLITALALATGLISTGLITLPSSFGVGRSVGNAEMYMQNQTAVTQGWQKFVPFYGTNQDVGGSYNWAVVIVLINLALAYFTIFGAVDGKKSRKVQTGQVDVPLPAKQY